MTLEEKFAYICKELNTDIRRGMNFDHIIKNKTKELFPKQSKNLEILFNSEWSIGSDCKTKYNKIYGSEANKGILWVNLMYKLLKEKK